MWAVSRLLDAALPDLLQRALQGHLFLFVCFPCLYASELFFLILYLSFCFNFSASCAARRSSYGDTSDAIIYCYISSWILIFGTSKLANCVYQVLVAGVGGNDSLSHVFIFRAGCVLQSFVGEQATFAYPGGPEGGK